MTKQQAILEILGINDEIKIGEVKKDICRLIDEIECEENSKWKKEAERLNVIVEWLREQCLDPALRK